MVEEEIPLKKPRQALWDKFWAEHGSPNNLFHRLLWLIRFIFSRAYAKIIYDTVGSIPNPRLIEIGCGSARTLHYLKEGYRDGIFFALDLSKEAVTLARDIDPDFHPTCANALSTPLPANCMDISYSIGLVEHFTREEAARMIVEKNRITRPGGYVAVMVPWTNSVYNLVVRKAFGDKWPFGDEDPFRRKELADFLAASGVIPVKVHVIYGSTLLGIGMKPHLDLQS